MKLALHTSHNIGMKMGGKKWRENFPPKIATIRRSKHSSIGYIEPFYSKAKGWATK